MKKILIGGSPCTFWSIARNEGRETQAEGLGWELFKNFLIAREKFKPDLFLYENNKSAAKAIKDQISVELGVDLMYINSALVSAQNRQRFYAFNWEVEQPQDRGVLLKDILETADAIPLNCTTDGKAQCLRSTHYKDGIRNMIGNNIDRKSCVAEPVKIFEATKQGYVEIEQGECVDLAMPNSKTRRGRKMKEKANCLTTTNGFYQYVGANKCRSYEVKDGFVTINGSKYPVKLVDGCYIFRKFTPIECERLQTLPDNYTNGVSDTQRIKGLGNGWTAEVIIHILQGALKDVPKDEEIVVLSMYDGIGTGRYCLDKMGFTNVKYFAYEIDKYAKQIALSNYPDIIQMGDAFDVRNPDWTIGY